MPARILVVEDNTASNQLMCYLLRAFGHTVFSARDGREGLEVARREHPDVVVLDLQMERVGGLEVAATMGADPELSRIPLVAVTAYAMLGDREEVLMGGFDGYLPKPIEPQEFVGQIESYLPEQLRTVR